MNDASRVAHFARGRGLRPLGRSPFVCASWSGPCQAPNQARGFPKGPCAVPLVDHSPAARRCVAGIAAGTLLSEFLRQRRLAPARLECATLWHKPRKVLDFQNLFASLREMVGICYTIYESYVNHPVNITPIVLTNYRAKEAGRVHARARVSRARTCRPDSKPRAITITKTETPVAAVRPVDV